MNESMIPSRIVYSDRPIVFSLQPSRVHPLRLCPSLVVLLVHPIPSDADHYSGDGWHFEYEKLTEVWGLEAERTCEEVGGNAFESLLSRAIGCYGLDMDLLVSSIVGTV
jgi:hypothetical protein